MIYKQLKVAFYRNINDEQILKIAIPDNKSIGSGLTYIVGENNTGKTSLIEAFQKNDCANNQSDKYVITSDIKDSEKMHFTVLDDSGNIRQELRLEDNSSYVLKDQALNPIPFEQRPKFIPSRKYWSPIVNNEMDFDSIRINFGNHYGYGALRQTSENINNSQIAEVFSGISRNKILKEEFIKRIKDIFPNFLTFATAFDGGTRFIEYRMTAGNSETRHRTDFLGDGVVSLMRIIGTIMVYNDDEAPIIIDEPELSLHPLAQKRLAIQLAELAKCKQIILATHSPYFINWEYIKNGACVNRLVKPFGKSTTIHTLDDYSKYEGLISRKNNKDWKQPYRMDIVAKEIFFEDNILFVEGQEDVGLIKSRNLLNDKINLFGYGVSGWEQFHFALKLANDMGLMKVAVLTDGGNTGVPDSVIADWQRLYPHYIVIKWNKEDIRDKDSNKSLGYFTINGDLKSDDQLDDFYEKINSINKYFSESW